MQTLNQTYLNLLQNLSTQLPTLEQASEIFKSTTSLVKTEPNLVPISTNVSVIGNTCGHFPDLLEAISKLGEPSAQNHFVFLGGYVNRLNQSVENLLYVCLLKLLHPQHVTLLRGKMEVKEICDVYGFAKELSEKYNSEELYTTACDLFNELPLGALQSKKVLYVHGGPAIEAMTIQEIENLNRHQATPKTGPITDLIWSDPDNDITEGVIENKRGAGKQYSKKFTEEFLTKNGLELIVRSNQWVAEGAKEDFDGKILTLYSASNYCNQMTNFGGVAKISHDLKRECFTYEIKREVKAQ
jgi:diadenosine tetraphosphatase ApaH/serine/threonine PP2A family protein phosphatase